MFSSNQIIKVSGELDKEDVLNALTFAIKCYGESIFTRKEKPVPLAYQECEDGTYCIGVAHDKGWTEFPFSYDLDIVASIICIDILPRLRLWLRGGGILLNNSFHIRATVSF